VSSNVQRPPRAARAGVRGGGPPAAGGGGGGGGGGGRGPPFACYWVRSHERKSDVVEGRIVHRNNVPAEANFYIDV